MQSSSSMGRLRSLVREGFHEVAEVRDSLAAHHALAAGLVAEEPQEIQGNIDHAVGFVDDDEAA